MKLTSYSDHVICETNEKPTKSLRFIKTREFQEVSISRLWKISIEYISSKQENPKDVVKKFKLSTVFSGTHGIGHTRMATESAITTQGSHPYSTWRR